RCIAKGESAELHLYDLVGESGISAQKFAADLKALGPVKNIDLRINSDGGDVFDGRAIYTKLVQHPARITARSDWSAASIASLIAMQADEIGMADGSFMMIHNAWGVAIADSAEMRRMSDLLDSVSETLVGTYAARSKQSRADVQKWMDEETWMTAQEAVDRGFADVVDGAMKMAACVHNHGLFRKVPAALMPRAGAV